MQKTEKPQDAQAPAGPVLEQAMAEQAPTPPEAGEQEPEAHTAREDEQTGRYKAALDKFLSAEKKDLPPLMLALLEKLGPLEQVEYLAENRAELVRAGLGAVPASPVARQRSLSEDEYEAARRGQASLYDNF